MGNQTDLIQKDTWGTDYRHVFGGADADKAIIASKLYKKEGPKQGGGGSNIISSMLSIAICISVTS